jgi:hypothetical protein
LISLEVAALFWRDIMEKTDTKDRDAGKRKLDDAIEDIESQQDEILEVLRTVNKKKIGLIKNVETVEKPQNLRFLSPTWLLSI